MNGISGAGIKHCPFCGAQWEFLQMTRDPKAVVELGFAKGLSFIVCSRCGCSGPSCEVREDAIEAWNRAPREPDLDHIVNANQKGKPKSYRIITINGTQINFIGWHRKDLDVQHKNWHYYESIDGKIYHFRSEHMVAVEEEEV